MSSEPYSSTLSEASHQHDFSGMSDIDPGLLAANAVMPFQQMDTLAYDPTLSAEAQAEKADVLYRAVGEVSLATTGLDYDALKQQAEANYYAYASEQIHQQSLDIAKALGEDVYEDEEPRARRSNKKHLVLSR